MGSLLPMSTTAETLPPPGTPKPRRGNGRPRLSRDERDARASLILQARLSNRRTEEICAEFRISRNTVYRALDFARRQGLLDKARDFLTLDLVPLSLAAYEEALRFGDLPLKVEVASKVFEGLNILGKHATLHLDPGAGAETFDDFRKAVATRAGLPPAGAGPDPEGSSAICDGEVLPPPSGPEGDQPPTGEDGPEEPGEPSDA